MHERGVAQAYRARSLLESNIDVCGGAAMSAEASKPGAQAYFTLSGDVNSDMVHRVFEAVRSTRDAKEGDPNE